MATRFDNTLFPSNNTDALFRAWASFIHDTLVTTGGWTNTADTGQIDLTTATTTGTTNTKVGYKIYAMADTLQASAPVYMRLDFGSGSQANHPGVWVTLGTGSDGSGTITGICFNGGSVTAPTFATGANLTTGSYNSYGSADTNRVQLGMFVNTGSAARFLGFSLERSKDANGDDTGHGLLLYGMTIGTTFNLGRYIVRAGGTQPADEGGLHYILSKQNPSSFGSNIGIGLVIPVMGYALQPGTGLAVTRSSDFVAETTFTVDVYGATRTYQHLNTITANFPAGSGDSSSRVAIRYD